MLQNLRETENKGNAKIFCLITPLSLWGFVSAEKVARHMDGTRVYMFANSTKLFRRGIFWGPRYDASCDQILRSWWRHGRQGCTYVLRDFMSIHGMLVDVMLKANETSNIVSNCKPTLVCVQSLIYATDTQ